MLRYSDEEAAPLAGGPRVRRTGGGGPQHELHHGSSSPPVAATFEDSKQDRRSFFGRIGGVCPICPCSGPQQQMVVENDKYYQDNYNDLSWGCSVGTHEDDGIWMNRSDQPGTIMALMVWILIGYSALTITLLAQHNNLPPVLAAVYCTICALALASHAKTSFTDPGAVPQGAVSIESVVDDPSRPHHMCSVCQTYKPPKSHHCRICNRCISSMDHHCPWMNNCVGAANLKHFILFLFYTWTGCAFALLVFTWNYFLCNSEDCMFSLVLVQLVRAMTIICISALLFTSSMLMNVTYGIMTGIGTIDRLKHKANNTIHGTDDEPMLLEDIFGCGPYLTWLIPVDPIFPDYDRVMGYSTTQRLLREREHHGSGVGGGGSLSSRNASSIRSSFGGQYDPV
eukprot:CAMPEP_0195289180 /NCGR_PEP_ID=MMETSP0707-20130614/5564_1 /TAXON_ID=33640 /ORGANISM="Asterionellopsis glacialis, Strain CCMP134" /LENGTH=396 /DNA_ID=CAMNT_0040349153 /DNA_START=87 /DNA_END=1277 /DNA_ORIENTATION=+